MHEEADGHGSVRESALHARRNVYGALMSLARYMQVLERFNQEAANPVFALMCDMRNLGSASGRTCLIVMGTSLTFQNFHDFF